MMEFYNLVFGWGILKNETQKFSDSQKLPEAVSAL